MNDTQLLLFKIGCATVVFITAFLGGVIPIRLTKYFPEQKTLSAANSLSAGTNLIGFSKLSLGILIGASLTHLLPGYLRFVLEISLTKTRRNFVSNTNIPWPT